MNADQYLPLALVSEVARGITHRDVKPAKVPT